jgi:hypothetical protein
MKTYIMHTDPGHGWLEVPVVDLQELGLSPHDFSKYSYRKNETVYLEEDCDMAQFWIRYEAQHGVSPKLRRLHTNNDSPIRTYKRL